MWCFKLTRLSRCRPRYFVISACGIGITFTYVMKCKFIFLNVYVTSCTHVFSLILIFHRRIHSHTLLRKVCRCLMASSCEVLVARMAVSSAKVAMVVFSDVREWTKY